LRVVEDHADGVAMTGPQSAHAMSQVHAVGAARALRWPIAHREDHAVAPSKRHHFGARLHPRPLLGQPELAAREVLLRLRQQNRHLERKDMFAIEVLVQRVEVPLAVLQKKRRRPRLARPVASRDEGRVRVRVAHIDQRKC
jgi:hypothetical protein